MKAQKLSFLWWSEHIIGAIKWQLIVTPLKRSWTNVSSFRGGNKTITTDTVFYYNAAIASSEANLPAWWISLYQRVKETQITDVLITTIRAMSPLASESEPRNIGPFRSRREWMAKRVFAHRRKHFVAFSHIISILPQNVSLLVSERRMRKTHSARVRNVGCK